MKQKIKKTNKYTEKVRKEIEKVRKADPDIQQLIKLRDKIQKEEKNIVKKVDKYRKKVSKRCWGLEREQEKIVSNLEKRGLTDDNMVYCEYCRKCYHAKECHDWVWVSGEPGDSETINSCPKGHQVTDIMDLVW